MNTALQKKIFRKRSLNHFFRNQLINLRRSSENIWPRFWMRWSGLSSFGRTATYLATWFTPPYKSRVYLAYYHPQGYIAPSATIHHNNLQLGEHVFLGERVIIYQTDEGSVKLGKEVQLYSDITIETGADGQVIIGDETHIQPRCQLSAYQGSVQIGCRVEIAPNCAFYPYNHGTKLGNPIRTQPLESRGGIIIGDDAWLGFGVVVLDGVQIGKGAVIGAGSVVTSDIPEDAIAIGSPARVVKMRS